MKKAQHSRPACDNNVQTFLTTFYTLNKTKATCTKIVNHTPVKYDQLYITNEFKLTKQPTTSDFLIFKKIMDVLVITDNIIGSEEVSEDAQHQLEPPVAEEIECQPDNITSDDTEDEEPPKKQRRRSTAIWSLLTVLMSLPPIQIDQYAVMYSKFKKCQQLG